jgi:phosphate:Na+ symporter
MDFSLLTLLTLAGALGFLIFGMKQMSDGLQKLAGPLMRRVLGGMTRSPLLGIITGFLVTALVQSSSATTVMVVSFVNAGIVTLGESLALIMGANIGTTVTAWLLSLLGFGGNVRLLALPLIAIGVPLMFTKKPLLTSWAQALIGLALIFLGLNEMILSVPHFATPELGPMTTILDTEFNFLALVLFASVGVILTMIAQSSSAAMALTLVMAHQGWLSFEMAAAMVLGENIGTTITANLAAIAGNVHAKRAARAHLIFNVIGLVWMGLLLSPALNGISILMVAAGTTSPFVNAASLPIALSIFHSGFNLINVLLLVWFIPQMARLVTRLQPAQGDESFHLEFIGKGIVQTAEISLHEAQKEIAKFAEIDRKGVILIHRLINETELDQQVKLAAKIQRYEEITDRIELEVDRFLTKLSTAQLSEASSQRVRSLLMVVNHLETIGDIFFQMSKSVERKTKKKLWFDQQQRDELAELYQLVTRVMDVMTANMEKPVRELNIAEAAELEKQVNELRHRLRTKNFKRIEKGKVKLEAGLIYNDLVSGYEKICDNALLVSEALTGMNLE